MHFAYSRFLAFSALAFLPAASHALTVSPSSDALGLANTLFLNSGGVFLQSATISGEFGQFGTYQNSSGTYGLPITGIVLSSGNVSDYADGTNNNDGTTTSFGTVASVEQQNLLGSITGKAEHFDVADLSIDFVADAATSSVTFFATFGSEEWPEFVATSFNDGFGLFVNGVNVAASGFRPINIDHPDMAPVAGTELNAVLAPGGNPVLRFDVPVNAGMVNNFQIILGDAGDHVLDTTVYLSSFFSDDGGGGVLPGSSEFNAILPSNPPDPETGAFILELPDVVAVGQVVWIDPPIAIGYTYVLDGDGFFESIVAPSLASVADLDGYIITIAGIDYVVGPGVAFDLLGAGLTGVKSFTLTGIDPLLGLDPADGAAFPLGVSFSGLGANAVIVQTPLTVDTPAPVPLPAAGWMMLAGLGGLAALRRNHVRT